MKKLLILLVPLFVLALFAIPTLAATTDTINITLQINSIRTIALDDTSYTFTPTADDLTAGYMQSADDESKLDYQSNDVWVIYAERDGLSYPSGVQLFVADDSSTWYEIKTTHTTNFKSGSAGTGSYDIEWKISGFGWTTPPGTYTETTTFTIAAS